MQHLIIHANFYLWPYLFLIFCKLLKKLFWATLLNFCIRLYWHIEYESIKKASAKNQLFTEIESYHYSGHTINFRSQLFIYNRLVMMIIHALEVMTCAQCSYFHCMYVHLLTLISTISTITSSPPELLNSAARCHMQSTTLRSL